MLHIVLLIVARCAKECTSGVPASAGLGSSAGLLSSSLLPEQQLGEGVPGFRNLPSFPQVVCDTAFVAPPVAAMVQPGGGALEPAFWRQCRLDTRLLLRVMGLLLLAQFLTHHPPPGPPTALKPSSLNS